MLVTDPNKRKKRISFFSSAYNQIQLERNFIECMHSAGRIRVLKYLELTTLVSAHLNVVFNSKQFLVQNCNLASCSWLDMNDCRYSEKLVAYVDFNFIIEY